MPKTSSEVRAKNPCSILNFVKHENPMLHEMIEELCVGYLFSTRKRPAGLTFLMPDDKTTKQLLGMLEKGNDEEVINVLQSLVIVSVLPDLGSFGDGESAVTFSGKKLPVVKASSASVELEGGVKVKDCGFDPRTINGKRAMISVYQVDGLPDMSKAQDGKVPAKPPRVKGGAQIAVPRQKLMSEVCQAQFGQGIDAAMQILVVMHANAVKTDPQAAKLIASQCSGDTFASLAILLQPYKEGKKYFEDDKLAKLLGDNLLGEGANVAGLYVLCQDLQAKYQAIQQSAQCDCGAIQAAINKSFSNGISKNTAPKVLAQIAKDLAPVLSQARGVAQEPAQILMEAELRLMSALAHENSFNCDQMQYLLQFQCNLNNPYFCNANLGDNAFFFSTSFLMVKSDALGFAPGRCQNGSTNLNSIGDDDEEINLSEFVAKENANKVAKAQGIINGLMKNLPVV